MKDDKYLNSKIMVKPKQQHTIQKSIPRHLHAAVVQFTLTKVIPSETYARCWWTNEILKNIA